MSKVLQNQQRTKLPYKRQGYSKTAVSQYKYRIMVETTENNSEEENSAPLTCKDIGYIIWFIFTILILCGVTVGAAVTGFDYLKTAFDSPNWNTTTGKITTSYVDKTGSENTGFSYTAKIEYSYIVDDRRYESDRIGFGEPVQENSTDAFAIIEPYEVGESVTVYYDPDDVAYAVIEPGPTFDIIWLCGVGLIFFLFALAVIVAALRG